MHAPLLLSRRAALLGLATAFSAAGNAVAFADAATDRRFVVVILRGAMDGMAAVVPYGDPGLSALRASLLPPAPGTEGGLLDLGGFYGLHPSLAGLHGMYRDGDAAFVHAVAGPYRTRSHFDAQDLLETGGRLQRLPSGWLNRVAQVVPRAGRPPLAGGQDVPLLLRGPAAADSWTPDAAAQPPADLYARVAALNASDRVTGPALAEALRARDFSARTLTVDPGSPGAPPGKPGGFAALARACGALLAAPDGPRIAALEVGGWDTHVDQKNRLARALDDLDAGMVALRAGLGDVWAKTAVLVMTEFGRTARVNGTNGTDHGTGTVAMTLGGAIRGGAVLGTWPGLSPAQLFEDRDLSPTTDLRAIAKGLLAAHLGVRADGLARVFPDSGGVEAMNRLIRTA